MYKYTLIISQYYHSRHYFIVHHTEDFIDRARAFASELTTYKRDADCTKKMYLGDLDPEYSSDQIRPRYNINDSGDIYFIQGNYANYLMEESWKYQEQTRRESRGFQKKSITDSINQYHHPKNVYEIVKKHFEIA